MVLLSSQLAILDFGTNAMPHWLQVDDRPAAGSTNVPAVTYPILTHWALVYASASGEQVSRKDARHCSSMSAKVISANS